MDLDTYTQVKTSIKKLLNIDLTYYKDEQMRRRLDAWLVRSGDPSWTNYFGRLSADGKELSRLRDYLTINVSEFFRDAERWEYLRRDVFPGLKKDAFRLHPTSGGLRVWSAGCSIGPEAYTLAILLAEECPNQRHYLLATDIDRGALKKATARGPYSADEIRNISPAQRSAYFDVDGQQFYVKEKLAKQITFREQNLMMDRFEDNFDLIVCRNVVIYFTNDAKTILYEKFQKALRLGGVLFLGGTEIISHSIDVGLQSRGISFYEKR